MQQQADTTFDDIRPYEDSEVRPALNRLLSDDEFIHTLLKLRKRPPNKWATAIATPFVRLYLRWKFSSINDIQDIQEIVRMYLDKMLKATADKFSISGLENLQKNVPYLFIGNHRDIVLDPALINYALITNGYDTVRIAIGDNLQSRSFISDLMKLNKSFIVKRSVKKPRERVMALQHLSAYIQKSIIQDKSSVWIAQSEGRAKDGLDITHPAIIKMIAMSKNSEVSLSDYIRSLNILPVAISYEIDPCDLAKARELYIRKETGSYTKKENEDFSNIMRGINGYKGSIHIAFGKPLEGEYENAHDLAKVIDHQIISLYRIHPSYKTAAIQLGLDTEDESHIKVSHEQKDYFIKRISAMPQEYQPLALEMYSNMIKLKSDLRESKVTSDTP